MFTWIKKIGEEKPDHPLFNTREAKKFLDDLPEDDPLTALDEITSWLTSVKDTPNFRPDDRAGVIMLLDETGQPLQAELLRQFIAAPHLHDLKDTPQWQGIHSFMQAVAEAYALCLQEYASEETPLPLKEQMPVFCVRLLRAVAERMKLELMRYQKAEQTVWDQLYGFYSFAEANNFAGAMVQAYPSQAVLSSPQRELLRAVVLNISSPTTLAQDQIEACFRFTARVAGLFDIKQAPDPGCPYYFDLSSPGAPEEADDKLQVTASTRFFGAVNALPQVAEIIRQYEQAVIDHGRGLRDESTPNGKLTVLKHLQIYWGTKKRLRQQERQKVSATVEVAHGFETISRLVKCVELSKITSLSEEDAAMLKKKAEMALIKEGVYYTPETWPILNMSNNGVGGLIPKTAGEWIKIGRLCGVKTNADPMWGVGMLRRIKIESGGEVRMGIRVFAQRPLSVWLRSLGKGADNTSNWESSSGSFVYTYLPVILLPDAQGLFVHATMLMESGSYAADSIYEMMMGERSANIRLTGLLEEGEDYEQVSFEWLPAVRS